MYFWIKIRMYNVYVREVQMIYHSSVWKCAFCTHKQCFGKLYILTSITQQIDLLSILVLQSSNPFANKQHTTCMERNINDNFLGKDRKHKSFRPWSEDIYIIIWRHSRKLERTNVTFECRHHRLSLCICMGVELLSFNKDRLRVWYVMTDEA